mgnify:CR=1 FL=1
MLSEVVTRSPRSRMVSFVEQRGSQNVVLLGFDTDSNSALIIVAAADRSCEIQNSPS